MKSYKHCLKPAWLVFTLLVRLGALELVAPRLVTGAPWVAPDWAGREPAFPAGSLYWQTGKYSTCPVLYRTLIRVGDQPVACAGFEARLIGFAYVFLNGQQVAAVEPKGRRSLERLEVELTGHLVRGTNVLIVSAPTDGLSVEGGLVYTDGRFERFATRPSGWKVQKLAPLTMLGYEPCMKAAFDDRDWFWTRETAGEVAHLTDQELEALCHRLAAQRLTRLDDEAGWRLQMLARKGIAIVDGEAHSWGGAGRLPDWLLTLAAAETTGTAPRFGTRSRASLPTTLAAAETSGKASGLQYTRAEALCRYVLLGDEALNLANHAEGLRSLAAPDREVVACQNAAETLGKIVSQMEAELKSGHFDQALILASKAERVTQAVRQGRVYNELNRGSENKFGWFDSPAVLDSDPAGWGLELGADSTIFTDALSPAALVTVRHGQLVISGWDKLPPLRVYNKQKPALGPVCGWAMVGGKLAHLGPDRAGLVYDAQSVGRLSENWILLANDLARGGDLPLEIVFLQAPTRIAFSAGEKGTAKVVVEFAQPETELFLLRPYKEWRGFLQMAEDLVPKTAGRLLPARYVEQCRLWSRAVLEYPVNYSEMALPEAPTADGWRIAEIFNYRTFADAWGTPPLRLAPLPPLTTYGLLCNDPGLKVVSDVQKLAWGGIWGDYLAAQGTNCIVYRIPSARFKRFAGFTSYCFGPTDIGEPGSLKEIESIKRTGANSFRPQSNNSGQRAKDTVDWCWAQGLQQMFNTDEKWVPDVVEHFRGLARQYRDYPADAVAYDLLNEPETREPRAYGALIKQVTNAIRQYDQRHLIYVEAMPAWGPGAAPFPRGAFETLQPTGDGLTVYSFHDYQYRLEPRWPNEQHDVRTILSRWIPAFRFSIEQRVPIHLGEFGGFEQTRESVFSNPCALTLMLDYLNVFDQFGWHWHYYANRGLCRIRQDGSLAESYVQEACRRYFSRGTFNAHWQGR